VITLHDTKNKIGGVCHYLFPEWEKGKPSTPLFAVPAVVSLLNMFHHRGSRVKDLEAQIIGGACRPGELKLIELSDKNIKVGYELLEKHGINIVNLKVGGYRNRKIVFDTHTSHTEILEGEHLRTMEWVMMNDTIEKIA
jgi:chemotaxis protein CheD